MATMAIVTLAMAAAIVSGHTAYLRRTVPSAWEEIPMRCDTTRLEDDTGRALELFSCRAPGGGLPPGRYRSPANQWSSDLTGLPAGISVIRITRAGEMTGFAIY